MVSFFSEADWTHEAPMCIPYYVFSRKTYPSKQAASRAAKAIIFSRAVKMLVEAKTPYGKHICFPWSGAALCGKHVDWKKHYKKPKDKECKDCLEQKARIEREVEKMRKAEQGKTNEEKQVQASC